MGTANETVRHRHHVIIVVVISLLLEATWIHLGSRKITNQCIKDFTTIREEGTKKGIVQNQQDEFLPWIVFCTETNQRRTTMSSVLTFRDATLADADAVVAITNEAFVADEFFKKKDYHQRFDLPSVIEMINTENSAFILAETTVDDRTELVGSLYLHWEIKTDENGREVIGKFSAVSVPSRFGKRGIGKALVDAAERRVIGLAKQSDTASASLQMGVISQREDLFPWYSKQGFVVAGEIRGDPEIERITLDEFKDTIYLVLMTKVLSL